MEGGDTGIGSLSDLYAAAVVERELPPEDVQERLWYQWLWKVDVNERIKDDLGDMNKSHILGVLLCVLRSIEEETGEVDVAGGASIAEVLPEMPLVHLSNKPIRGYSVRELMDQVRCLQLNWGKVLSACAGENAQEALLDMMGRAGHLCTHAYPGGMNSPLDDPQHITPIPAGAPGGPEMFIVTRRFLREFVITVGAMFRVAHFVTNATVVPELAPSDRAAATAAFRTHLIEASVDEFYHLQQVLVLAPGMRLTYKADFAGMYNDVSQVVYFHYPKYSRQPQLSLGEILGSAAHTLPLMRQLMPDLPVVYDDDTEIPGITPGAQPVAAGFAWLVSCGTIFLLNTQTGAVHASSDASLLPLVDYFCKTTGRSLHSVEEEGGGVEEEDENARQRRLARARRAWLTGDGESGGGTAHGHAVLL